MSHESPRSLFFDPNAPHPRTLNRKTPSKTTHINTLPPEILQMIFWHCCDFDFGPGALTLVCRSWYAISCGYSALWTFITFERGNTPNHFSKRTVYPVLCKEWPHVQSALSRTGTYTIALALQLNSYIPNDEERIASLLSRCHNLRVITKEPPGYYGSFGSGVTMPNLERLSLAIKDGFRTDQLLRQIANGSPRMKSLSIFGYLPSHLIQLSSLLKRIIQLELQSITQGPGLSEYFFKGLPNLEALALKSPLRGVLPPFNMPKLVSLHIGNLSLPFGPQHQFPVLETLTLVGLWSNLPLISAPNLRNLILRDSTTSSDEAMLALRRATVRPLSLFTDFISELYLPDLLEIWSNLSELHLRGKYNVCIPGSKTVTALAGQGLVRPLCPSLRYFTVHVEQSRKDLEVTNRSIERLQAIVEERKRRGVGGLQRVLCVWDFWEDKEPRWPVNRTSSKEIEWVDIL